MRLGAGERAIGQTYAANTAGAIAGVLLAVHFGLPLLGVKGLIIAGAAVDLALGALLLGAMPGRWRLVSAAAAASLCAVAVAAAVFGVNLDLQHMASGVYRHGALLESDHKVLMYEDGKTATVSVTDASQVTTIRTNGKPDAALGTHGRRDRFGDEATMVLAGALPLLLKPEAREIVYRLLKSDQATRLQQIALAESRLQQVNRAIGWIKRNYREAFAIDTVAA